jgi:hypothetical protein
MELFSQDNMLSNKFTESDIDCVSIIKQNNNSFHHYHETVMQKYKVLQYIKGPINCGIEKNPLWVIEENEKKTYLLFCEPDILCILCEESYKKIIEFERKERKGRKLFWTKKDKNNKNINYIRANHNNSCIYIHQAIMNFYGNGSGTGGLSVDHIDRNPLNNQLENLRIATSEEQHSNSNGVLPDTKKNRRNDAVELPDEISQKNDIPKFINYNLNKYGKEREFSREYFKIEGHPALNGKYWTGTTKKNISIKEKLQQAKDALEFLNNNGVLPETPERELPQYVSYYVERGSHLLAWQKTVGDDRLSKKITLEKDYFDLDKKVQEQELQRLNREVIVKYDNKYSIFALDEEELNKIQKEKDAALPTYVRFQDFYDGKYLVFNKGKDDVRLSTTAKLPPNYNINKELHILNSKIIEKFGQKEAISLDKFPYDEQDDIVEIPKGIYVSLKCKNPYLIMKNDNNTFSMPLPERYDLNEQIQLFMNSENKSKDQLFEIEEVKQHIIDNGIKPDNISIVFKDKKSYQLQYKLKTKEHRHDKAMTIPKENININIELIKLNDHIITRFGKEFGILLC